MGPSAMSSPGAMSSAQGAGHGDRQDGDLRARAAAGDLSAAGLARLRASTAAGPCVGAKALGEVEPPN